MATQTTKIKFNGVTGQLKVETKGFFGNECTEITKAVTSKTGATVLSEVETEEAQLQPPPLSQEVPQEHLA